MSLPTGFEGLILHSAKAPAINLPQGFKGVVLSYSTVIKFIVVKSSRGVPIVGATVSVNNPTSADFVAITDTIGTISGNFDSSGTIQVTVKSGTTFYNYTIDGADQSISTILTFPTEYI